MTNKPFVVIADFSQFCELANGSLIEFDDPRYLCINNVDYASPCEEWFTSRQISRLAYARCRNLRHGRNIFGCSLDSLMWLVITYGNSDYLAIPFVETVGCNVLYVYDPYWLLRTGVFTFDGNYVHLNSRLHASPVIEMPRHSCFIPGSSNPSHFLEHIVKHEIISFTSIGRKYNVLTLSLPRWQREFMESMWPSWNCNLFALASGICSGHPHVCFLKMKDAFMFEDVPQWLGLQHSRRIVRQHKIVTNKTRSITYLCRSRHEKWHGINPGRVVDYKEVCNFIHRNNGLVLFPENHSFWEVQRLISESDIVVADPGSCNIHALLSSIYYRGSDAILIQLTPNQHFCSDAHESLRHFEWYYNLDGVNFQFVIGASAPFDIPGSVSPALYADSLRRIVWRIK